MGALWNMGTFTYNSDDTNAYIVGLSNLVAVQGGFSSAVGLMNYPRGWKTRRVYGINNVGAHQHIPIASAGNAKFTTGGTFDLHGSTYAIQGRVGEKRVTKI